MSDANGTDRRGALAGIGAAALASGVILPGMARAAASAGATSVRETSLHGRDAFTLANDQMQVSVLPGGGFVGEVRLRSGEPRADVNPMRVPFYPTIDPYTYDSAPNKALYGDSVQVRLMSGYMGHFTCFPQFGHQGENFETDGYINHGEAIIVKWQRDSAPDNTLAMSAELPRTRYHFARTMTMLPDETVVYVKETATNRMIQDRPIQWVQHVTMGRPFVVKDRMFVDASVQRVMQGRGDDATLSAWPESQDADGQMRHWRVFSGKTGSWLMRRKGHNWFVAYNTDLKLLFGQIWDAAINPWLLDWQENKSVKIKPWNSNVVARGLCWGDSMIIGTKSAVMQGSNFGVPQYGWINGLASRSQRYATFVTKMPDGWQGTGALTAENGVITIVERNGGRTLRLKASQI